MSDHLHPSSSGPFFYEMEIIRISRQWILRFLRPCVADRGFSFLESGTQHFIIMDSVSVYAMSEALSLLIPHPWYNYQNTIGTNKTFVDKMNRCIEGVILIIALADGIWRTQGPAWWLPSVRCM